MIINKTSGVFKSVSIFFLFGSLVGCAPVPPYDFSLNDVQPSQRVIRYDLKSTVVTLASPAEKIGPLPPDSNIAVPIWQTALQDAVDRSAIFADPAPASIDLECKLLKIDIPLFGGDMTTDIAARYQIIDRSTGKILFDQVIDTPGTVSFGYAFLGGVRAKESINVAAQNNIQAFLIAIEESPLAETRGARPSS
jgi:hypothetical protein